MEKITLYLGSSKFVADKDVLSKALAVFQPNGELRSASSYNIKSNVQRHVFRIFLSAAKSNILPQITRETHDQIAQLAEEFQFEALKLFLNRAKPKIPILPTNSHSKTHSNANTNENILKPPSNKTNDNPDSSQKQLGIMNSSPIKIGDNNHSSLNKHSSSPTIPRGVSLPLTTIETSTTTKYLNGKKIILKKTIKKTIKKVPIDVLNSLLETNEETVVTNDKLPITKKITRRSYKRIDDEEYLNNLIKESQSQADNHSEIKKDNDNTHTAANSHHDKLKKGKLEKDAAENHNLIHEKHHHSSKKEDEHPHIIERGGISLDKKTTDSIHKKKDEINHAIEKEKTKTDKKDTEKHEEMKHQKKEKEDSNHIRQEKEEAEKLKKQKEEADRIKKEKEEAEKLKKEKEEAEKLKKEKEEAEKLRKEKEEADRLKREEEAEQLRKEKEEAEKLRKEKEEAERLKKEKEEAEKLRKEKEETERLKREEEAEQLRKEKEEAERLKKEEEISKAQTKKESDIEDNSDEILLKEKDNSDIEDIKQDKTQQAKSELEFIPQNQAQKPSKTESPTAKSSEMLVSDILNVSMNPIQKMALNLEKALFGTQGGTLTESTNEEQQEPQNISQETGEDNEDVSFSVRIKRLDYFLFGNVPSEGLGYLHLKNRSADNNSNENKPIDDEELENNYHILPNQFHTKRKPRRANRRLPTKALQDD